MRRKGSDQAVDSKGRRQFAEAIEERRPEERSEQWKPVRRGWWLGEEQFRKELLKQVHQMAGAHHYGEEIGQSSEEKARRIIAEELKKLGRKQALWSAAQTRCRKSEDRAAVAARNDGRQTLIRATIRDRLGEQRDVSPEGVRHPMTTINGPACPSNSALLRPGPRSSFAP